MVIARLEMWRFKWNGVKLVRKSLINYVLKSQNGVRDKWILLISLNWNPDGSVMLNLPPLRIVRLLLLLVEEEVLQRRTSI